MIPECQICRFYHNNSSRYCHRKCKNNGGNIHADESARTSYFFRPFVGQEINSTPKLRAWGWFSRFPVCRVHDSYTSGAFCSKREWLRNPFYRVSLLKSILQIFIRSHTGKDGGTASCTQPATSCSKKNKNGNNKENNVTLCYRTRHWRSDIR